MTEIKTLHRAAMEQTDLAIAARLKGDAASASAYIREAFDLEAKAARLLAAETTDEPTRSILLRSAASLALDCNLTSDAEKLICTALTGNPPAEIAEELRDLLEQVQFQRHLELRGVSLYRDELQMSIAGKVVGLGIAPTDAVIDRVEKTETLLYRTAERKQQRPYRDRGRREKALQESMQLYMTVPRAASFAVTFKVGKSDQLNFPGMSTGEEIIDELLECLEIFTRGEEEKLRERIKEEDYYQNFIGLARGLAPDGKQLNLVGFTTIRGDKVKKVSLRARAQDVTTAQQSRTEESTEPPVPHEIRVSGTLKMADSRTEGKDEIQIVALDGIRHAIIVPHGMMSDIVRPLWDTKVTVTGTQQANNKIVLKDISPISLEE